MNLNNNYHHSLSECREEEENQLLMSAVAPVVLPASVRNNNNNRSSLAARAVNATSTPAFKNSLSSADESADSDSSQTQIAESEQEQKQEQSEHSTPMLKKKKSILISSINKTRKAPTPTLKHFSFNGTIQQNKNENEKKGQKLRSTNSLAVPVVRKFC